MGPSLGVVFNLEFAQDLEHYLLGWLLLVGGISRAIHFTDSRSSYSSFRADHVVQWYRT